MTKRTMQVHRFSDLVAIALPGNGPTVYLTRLEADALANALARTAGEIAEGVPFTASTVGTFSYPLPGAALSSARDTRPTDF